MGDRYALVMDRSLLAPPALELSERGTNDQRSDRRLFVQLLAFSNAWDVSAVTQALERARVQGVLYEDVLDPLGVALLTMSEDPAWFVDTLRPMLREGPLDSLTLRPEMTMFGRTYSQGYEADLDDTLLHRPRRYALDPEWPWAVWYPLRRSGRFEQLPEDERSAMIREHAQIGSAFGRGGFARDIRLASHGLDPRDNDFTLGLIGRELAPLSQLVQHMRSTQQTSLYLDRLGPFFVGRAAWRSGMPKEASAADERS